jgi:sterol desaturase/sphingolipid hydroxylase (fatty acid hydroxylase superfamily)
MLGALAASVAEPQIRPAIPGARDQAGRVRLMHKAPTPFAAFSFHPLEGALEALIIPVLIMIVLVFVMTMTVLGVVSHLGYELYPAGFARGRVTRRWISATRHQAHHRKVHFNYGLYFTFWDRWIDTRSRAARAGGVAAAAAGE